MGAPTQGSEATAMAPRLLPRKVRRESSGTTTSAGNRLPLSPLSDNAGWSSGRCPFADMTSSSRDLSANVAVIQTPPVSVIDPD
ncbi:hypothetical protein GCM10020216_057360 [Nonomuraea helvata]